jgi:hypothetical protein
MLLAGRVRAGADERRRPGVFELRIAAGPGFRRGAAGDGAGEEDEDERQQEQSPEAQRHDRVRRWRARGRRFGILALHGTVLPTDARSKQEAGAAVVRFGKAPIRNIREWSPATGSLAPEGAFHPVCDRVPAKPTRQNNRTVTAPPRRARARRPRPDDSALEPWARVDPANSLDGRAGTACDAADGKPEGTLRFVTTLSVSATVPRSLAKEVRQTARGSGTRPASSSSAGAGFNAVDGRSVR